MCKIIFLVMYLQTKLISDNLSIIPTRCIIHLIFKTNPSQLKKYEKSKSQTLP